ncbi:unnamed protein product [Clonostachys solani]|uniref:Uncharacterized protein n=1 Tax=Clonostachys solani TaxID=160281 RepID=A0A9P0EP23_9HYPO|nr:unnamed protein product [Clonostachys solani]
MQGDLTDVLVSIHLGEIVVVVVIVVGLIPYFIHEAEVHTAFATDNKAMRAADDAPVWKLARTFVVIAAVFTKWDQALSEIVAAWHLVIQS